MERSRMYFCANEAFIALYSNGAFAAAVPTVHWFSPATDPAELAGDKRCAMHHKDQGVGMGTGSYAEQALDPREGRYPAADRWIQERA